MTTGIPFSTATTFPTTTTTNSSSDPGSSESSELQGISENCRVTHSYSIIMYIGPTYIIVVGVVMAIVVLIISAIIIVICKIRGKFVVYQRVR